MNDKELELALDTATLSIAKYLNATAGVLVVKPADQTIRRLLTTFMAAYATRQCSNTKPFSCYLVIAVVHNICAYINMASNEVVVSLSDREIRNVAVDFLLACGEEQ